MKKIQSFLLFAFFASLPLERIPSFELAGFTIKFSYILSVLLLLIIIFQKVFFINRKLVFSDLLLILFWLVSFISSIINSPNLHRSLVILALWLMMILLYLNIPKLIKDNTEKIIKVILISAFCVSLFGIYQFVGDSLGLSSQFTGLRLQYTNIVLGFPRIQSVALEPLYFANFLMVPFFIAVSLFCRKKTIGYYLLINLFLVNIILTISRGAYIALTISLFFWLIYLLLIRRDWIRTIQLLSAIILSVIISIGLVSGLNGNSASQSFANHSSEVATPNQDSSAIDRIGTYKIAYNLFKNKPFLGNGVGSFGLLANNSKDRSQSSEYGIVNNEYLEILSENGSVGLILFFAFLIMLLLEISKKFVISNELEKQLILALTCGVLAIFIQYNFFSTLYIIYIWAFLALLKSFTLNRETANISKQ